MNDEIIQEKRLRKKFTEVSNNPFRIKWVQQVDRRWPQGIAFPWMFFLPSSTATTHASITWWLSILEFLEELQLQMWSTTSHGGYPNSYHMFSCELYPWSRNSSDDIGDDVFSRSQHAGLGLSMKETGRSNENSTNLLHNLGMDSYHNSQDFPMKRTLCAFGRRRYWKESFAFQDFGNP